MYKHIVTVCKLDTENKGYKMTHVVNDLKGETITLRGKSSKGKNRIREQGDKWIILGLPTGVLSMSPIPSKVSIQSVKTAARGMGGLEV